MAARTWQLGMQSCGCCRLRLLPPSHPGHQTRDGKAVQAAWEAAEVATWRRRCHLGMHGSVRQRRRGGGTRALPSTHRIAGHHEATDPRLFQGTASQFSCPQRRQSQALGSSGRQDRQTGQAPSALQAQVRRCRVRRRRCGGQQPRRLMVRSLARSATAHCCGFIHLVLSPAWTPAAHTGCSPLAPSPSRGLHAPRRPLSTPGRRTGPARA